MVFKPGQSGNPSGVSSGGRRNREKLTQMFVRGLLTDFEVHGVKTIERVRLEDPATYLRVISSMLPKELEISNNIGELTDDQLADVITALQSAISAGIITNASEAAGRAEQDKDLSSVH